MKNYAKSETFGAPLTVERLRSVVQYDADSGVFTWREGGRGRFKRAGAAAGTVSHYGYLIIMMDGKRHMAHRLAWLWVHGAWPLNEIDHINGVRDDNRIVNLRDVTRAINRQNMRKARSDSKSGVLGVSWSKSSRCWVANLQTNGKLQQVGKSSSIEEARQAYLKAKREQHEGCTI